MYEQTTIDQETHELGESSRGKSAKKEEEAERLHEAVVLSHEVKLEKEVQQEDDQLCGVQKEKVDRLLNLALLNGRFLMKISCRYRWHNDVMN